MQTFLPYADFKESAKVLDVKRLGKQRVETMQIMNAILIPGHGWRNHPAVKMWRGHENTLWEYQQAICNEWTSRGYKDTCLEKTRVLVAGNITPCDDTPEWLGNDELHLSHQSNLIRKLPEFYASKFPDVPDDLPYVWPIGE